MLIENKIYLKDIEETIENDSIDWEKLKNKSILITGATGLICSCLVDVLMYRNKVFNDNIKIYAIGRNLDKAKEKFSHYLNNKNFRLFMHDINEPLNWTEKVDFIIHGASPAHPIAFSTDSVGTMLSNFVGMNNILQFALECKPQKTVFISSGEIYGEIQANRTGFTENDYGFVDILSSRACYPSSKRATETLCASYVQQYRLDISVARPCHIYGGTTTKEDSRVFAQFIRNAINGEDIIMKSKGEQVRSYCYVFDCVSALLTILLHGKSGEAYNIADDNSVISIADLAKMIADYVGQKVVFELPSDIEQKGYSVVSRAALDSSKLQSLNCCQQATENEVSGDTWKAKTDLFEGIKKTIEILRGIKKV